jgi:hypothetical protein
MDEIDQIQAQIGALLKARNCLLNQTPSDMVSVTDVTEKIVALNHRQAAITGLPATLTVPQEQSLQAALDVLAQAVRINASATSIVVAATALVIVV